MLGITVILCFILSATNLGAASPVKDSDLGWKDMESLPDSGILPESDPKDDYHFLPMPKPKPQTKPKPKPAPVIKPYDEHQYDDHKVPEYYRTPVVKPAPHVPAYLSQIKSLKKSLTVLEEKASGIEQQVKDSASKLKILQHYIQQMKAAVKKLKERSYEPEYHHIPKPRYQPTQQPPKKIVYKPKSHDYYDGKQTLYVPEKTKAKKHPQDFGNYDWKIPEESHVAYKDPVKHKSEKKQSSQPFDFGWKPEPKKKSKPAGQQDTSKQYYSEGDISNLYGLDSSKKSSKHDAVKVDSKPKQSVKPAEVASVWPDEKNTLSEADLEQLPPDVRKELKSM